MNAAIIYSLVFERNIYVVTGKNAKLEERKLEFLSWLCHLGLGNSVGLSFQICTLGCYYSLYRAAVQGKRNNFYKILKYLHTPLLITV